VITSALGTTGGLSIDALLLDFHRTTIPNMRVMTTLLTGTGLPDWMAVSPRPFAPSFIPLCLLGSVVVLAVLALTRTLQRQVGYRVLFVSLISLGILFKFWITPGAEKIHHAFMLYPFPHMLMAIIYGGALAAWSERSRQLRRLAGGAVLLALLTTVAWDAVIFSHGVARLRTEGARRRWSEVSYDLAAYLRQLSGRHIVFLDWGFLHAQRLLLVDAPVSLEERYLLRSPEEDIRALRLLIERPGAVFVLFSPRRDVIPSYQAYFLRALEDAGGRPWTRTEFVQKDGQPLYEVYSREPLPPAGGPPSSDDRAECSNARECPE
jgi:hypothetical protein